jgi:hypothetical protein
MGDKFTANRVKIEPAEACFSASASDRQVVERSTQGSTAGGSVLGYTGSSISHACAQSRPVSLMLPLPEQIQGHILARR